MRHPVGGLGARHEQQDLDAVERSAELRLVGVPAGRDRDRQAVQPGLQPGLVSHDQARIVAVGGERAGDAAADGAGGSGDPDA